MKTYPKSPNSSLLLLRRFALVLSVPLFPLVLIGQNDDDGEKEVVELSPFQVDAADDNGYRATHTLGGTRLKTSLKDVGASLTILTTEFMEDLGVTSFDEALLFTPSVDSMNGDNESGGRSQGQVTRYGTGQAYSIRGFYSNSGEQSISHDFFEALDPTDNYNLERVTLSLGPNALLIGVGNPQGVAVTSTKRARANLRSTQFQYQMDSEGSNRFSFDHNQPLIEDKLAIRVNGLYDKKREFRANEGKNQERITIGLTAKPLENTTLTLNHEHYKLDVNTSSLIWGFDGRSLRWAQAGKPTVDFVNQGMSWAAADMTFVDSDGNPVPVAAGVVDEDGFVDSQSDFDPNGALGFDNQQRIVYVTGLDGEDQVVNFRYQGNLQTGTFGYQGGNAYQSSEDPWTALGLDRNTNLNGGTWDDPSIQEEGDWTQFFVEHKIVEGLYLELGASIADHKRSLDPTFLTTVQIDPNRYLPDGSDNPGFLSPYVHQAAGQRREYDTSLEEYRATLSYELDLTEKNRLLGHHNLAGLYQMSEKSIDLDIQRIYNNGTIGVDGWHVQPINGANIVGGRAYFIDGNEPVIPDLNYVLRNASDIDGVTSSGATEAQMGLIQDLELHSFTGAQKSRNETDSMSLGWQARWFDSKLITVMGYRVDDVRNFTGISDNRNDLASFYADDVSYVASHNWYTLSKDLPYDSTAASDTSGISRTYGAVYHATDWLSLTYNQSANFLPVTNAGVANALGEALPDGKGETEEFGFMLNLLEDKLSVSVKKFETSAKNRGGNANSGANGFKNVLTRLETYFDAGDSHFTDFQPGGELYPIRRADLNDIQSYTADGYELTAIYNPSNKWRMSFSFSDNTNVNTERYPGLVEYIETMNTKYEGVETWRNYASELYNISDGIASDSFDLDHTLEEDRALALSDADYITEQLDSGLITLQNIQNLIGVTNNRSGQYGANALVTRVFHEGAMKGWSIGGNGRWRSGSVLGYESQVDGNGDALGLYDPEKPWKGESFWEFGGFTSYKTKLKNGMNLRIQLNIQNLLDEQGGRLVKSDYDLAGYKGEVGEVVPVLWELRRPRKFILSTTIDF